MTVVVVPCGESAPNEPCLTRIFVELVTQGADETWGVAQGLKTIDGVPLSASKLFTIKPSDEDPVARIELFPQSTIACDNETAYRFTISLSLASDTSVTVYVVSVPESSVPILLRDLVGAPSIPPGDIPAQIVADVESAAAAAAQSAAEASGYAIDALGYANAALADGQAAVADSEAAALAASQSAQSASASAELADEYASQAADSAFSASRSAASASAAEALIDASIAGGVAVVMAEDDESVTLRLDNAAIIAQGSSPYDHVTLVVRTI